MDELDLAAERAALEVESQRTKINPTIAPGVPGECAYCGDEHPRLVKSACPRCRDSKKLG